METWNKLKLFVQSTSLFKESSEKSKARQTSDNRGHVKYTHVSDNDDDTDLKAEFCQTRSIDEILDDIGLRFFHFKLFLILGFLNITDALEVSVLSIIIPSLKSDWNITSVEAGVLTLSIPTGMIAGCWFWGWVADKYGRKTCLISSAIFIIVFAFASVWSPNYYWLWICLFLVGFGIANTMETYVMTMELFPPKFRTTFTILNSVFWTLGFLVSAIASTQLSVIGYRWALAIVCFPTTIFLVCIIFLPDTPHYHLAAGDEQKALDILQNFAPEMDLSNIKLRRAPDIKRADIRELFRHGVWKITLCVAAVAFVGMMTYYFLVYTASDIANNARNTSTIVEHNKLLGNSNANFSSLMAWMNLPELFILGIVAFGCYVCRVKNVLLSLMFLAVAFQTIVLCVLNHRTVLLVFTMLSRSVLMSATTTIFVLASLLYPTANRSIGVGVCVSMGRFGMLLGPFIFETFFENAYFYGSVYNIIFLLLGFTATVLLPSPSGATLN